VEASAISGARPPVDIVGFVAADPKAGGREAWPSQESPGSHADPALTGRHGMAGRLWWDEPAGKQVGIDAGLTSGRNADIDTSCERQQGAGRPVSIVRQPSRTLPKGISRPKATGAWKVAPSSICRVPPFQQHQLAPFPIAGPTSCFFFLPGGSTGQAGYKAWRLLPSFPPPSFHRQRATCVSACVSAFPGKQDPGSPPEVPTSSSVLAMLCLLLPLHQNEESAVAWERWQVFQPASEHAAQVHLEEEEISFSQIRA
jgi:hypothetical protein